MGPRTLIIMNIVLLFSACGNNNDNSVKLPPKALVLLRLDSPYYLQDDVSKDTTIRMTISDFDSSKIETYAEAQQAVMKDIIIENYPGQQPVAGKWENAGTRMIFRPQTALSSGDYIIRFPKANTNYRTVVSGLINVHPRPYNVFHVGPLTILRLREVDLLRDKGSSSKNTYNMTLSYAGSSKATLPTSIKLEQQSGSTWNQLALSAKSVKEFSLNQTLDTSKRLKLTVTGGDLDGKWTGKAGSGPAVVEFTPDDHTSDPGQIIYHVPPDLDIELPSGKKKTK